MFQRANALDLLIDHSLLFCAIIKLLFFAVYFDICMFFVKYRFKMHFYNSFIKASAFLYFLWIIILLILSNIFTLIFYLDQYVLFLVTFLFLRSF